ncbi:hypothetical protein ACR80L_09505 [Bacillus velezensis]|uniref:hypothetical protein n=1 Tax=Bacillus velezensis TaxID=492670 RepID=UPI003F5C3C44
MEECFIIDACVITSASPKTPVSKRVATFLEMFLETKNKIGMTKTLKEEWLRHPSPYTAKVYGVTKKSKKNY